MNRFALRLICIILITIESCASRIIQYPNSRTINKDHILQYEYELLLGDNFQIFSSEHLTYIADTCKLKFGKEFRIIQYERYFEPGKREIARIVCAKDIIRSPDNTIFKKE